MSPRGQAPIVNKLKDLFYSLTDKGVCQVIVFSPNEIDVNQVSKLFKQLLPQETSLNWVAVDPIWNFTRFIKTQRVQVTPIYSKQHSDISIECLIQMLLPTKNTTKVYSRCCCIC